MQLPRQLFVVVLLYCVQWFEVIGVSIVNICGVVDHYSLTFLYIILTINVLSVLYINHTLLKYCIHNNVKCKTIYKIFINNASNWKYNSFIHVQVTVHLNRKCRCGC